MANTHTALVTEARAPVVPAERSGVRNVPIPPLPEQLSKRSGVVLISFLLCVVLPTVLVSVYLTFFAARQYVSEFRFAVTETSSSSSSSSAGSALSGIASLMGGAGAVSNSAMQNYIVIDYLLSQEAVEELDKRINVRALYSGPQVNYDPWNRFDPSQPIEKFVDYWKQMVSANYDPMTGLAVARVSAFSPEDARKIADTLATLSEELVNKIARRSQLDAVRFAEKEVQRAEDRMKQVRTSLTQFRYQEGMIDPSSSVSNNTQQAATLRLQLIEQQTQLSVLGNMQMNANAPAMQVLRARLAATQAQLQKVEREVGQNREGNQVLADITGRYEQLDLDRQYAQQILLSTMQSLDQARANAAAQHLYLTPYVKPATPESASFPDVSQTTLITALSLFALWIIGLMVVRSIRSHV